MWRVRIADRVLHRALLWWRNTSMYIIISVLDNKRLPYLLTEALFTYNTIIIEPTTMVNGITFWACNNAPTLTCF